MHDGDHILSSAYFGGPYRCDEMSQLFTDSARIRRWMQVEAALARCQARHGVIPEGAAQQISRCAALPDLDLAGLLAERQETGHSLLPVIRALGRAAGPDAAPFVHFGATTQDIQDSGQSMALAAALDVLDRRSAALQGALAALARAHAGTVCVGRTHFQPALPVTLGLKIAGWIDELERARERLREAQARVPALQLFGAAGTASALGVEPARLQAEVAEELGLIAAAYPWHNARDRVVEFLWVCLSLCRAAARASNELIQLSRPEMRGLSFTWAAGARSSSTMPHKRNPEACEQVLVLTSLVQGALFAALSGPPPEHERDFRGVRAEWALLPEAATYVGRALELLLEALGGLTIDAQAQREVAGRYMAEMCSEALMFALARHLGKDRAYELLSRAFERAAQEGRSAAEALRSIPEVSAHLTGDELDRLLDPERHIAQARALVEGRLAKLPGGGR